MTSRIAQDPRIDPRIKAVLGAIPDAPPAKDAANREQLLAAEATPEAAARVAAQDALFAMMDNEAIAPSAGLTITTHTFTSAPAGNEIKVQFIRPDGDAPAPCIYYIHGGGMQTMSCFNGMYTAWGRIIAAQGVAVAMVDFRNCLRASSATEVLPFPAGLNDCVSGLKWLHANAATLNIDPARIVVAGESGGGNLSIATVLKLKRDGDLGLVKGLYALCPYIAGQWPQAQYSSSTENNGLLLDLVASLADVTPATVQQLYNESYPGLEQISVLGLYALLFLTGLESELDELMAVGLQATTVAVTKDSGGNVVCWMGSYAVSGTTYYGVWAQNFWAGGTGPATAKIWLDGSGNAHFSGYVESGSTIT